MHILLIEDNPDDAEWIQLHLADSGNFQLILAENLQKGLEVLTLREVDTILLDLSLPDSQGLDGLNRIQSNFPKIPVVVCSGNIDKLLVMTAVEQGAQDYLIKNQINREVLERSLQYAINRKRIEENLRLAHDDLNNLLSVIPSVLIGIDEEEKVYQWNHMAETTFGIPSQDAVGHRFSHLGIRWNWQDILRSLRACREQQRNLRLHNCIYGRNDETTTFFDFNFAYIQTGISGKGRCLLLGIDVTERNQLEAQLALAQKMESIGQLAAGVAHEINTPMQFIHDNLAFLQDKCRPVLTVLQSYAAFLRTPEAATLPATLYQDAQAAVAKLKLDFLQDQIPEALQDSLEGAERVTSIVRAMKEFSHPGTTKKKFIDLNRGLENTLTVSRNEWKYVAEVETRFDDSLPPVLCLPGELNQVFLNLIVNAGHAIADVVGKEGSRKGRITITTRVVGHSVEVRIGDTGTGIPEAIQSRIFEPFFTTKEVGKGTGQGLAIAHAVITKKHQGSIAVESTMGQGTTFIIHLPILAAESDGTGSLSQENALIPQGEPTDDTSDFVRR